MYVYQLGIGILVCLLDVKMDEKMQMSVKEKEVLLKET